MASMRSGLISSFATPWPDGASVVRFATGSRLAGRDFVAADFFADLLAGFLAGAFLAPLFFVAFFAGLGRIGMIVARRAGAAH